jgi:hypothetical protein
MLHYAGSGRWSTVVGRAAPPRRLDPHLRHVRASGGFGSWQCQQDVEQEAFVLARETLAFLHGRDVGPVDVDEPELGDVDRQDGVYGSSPGSCPRSVVDHHRWSLVVDGLPRHMTSWWTGAARESRRVAVRLPSNRARQIGDRAQDYLGKLLGLERAFERLC